MIFESPTEEVAYQMLVDAVDSDEAAWPGTKSAALTHAANALVGVVGHQRRHPVTVQEVAEDRATRIVAEALAMARASDGEGSSDELMVGMDWHVAGIAVRALRDAGVAPPTPPTPKGDRMTTDTSIPADLADVGTRVDDGHIIHLVGTQTTMLRYSEGRFKRTREVPLTYCDFVVVSEKYHVLKGEGQVTCRRCRLYVIAARQRGD